MNARTDRTDHPDSADLLVRVLGPLQVTRAREEVHLGGPKERLVLAVLLARANQVVAVDALTEAVWAGLPPRSADRTLQSYVARLRGALEPDRPAGAPSTVLLTVSPGYRLQLADSQLDALRFAELAHRGGEQLRRGDDAAAGTLHQALALWSGDAYAEFVDVEACAVESRRLAELRLVAVEDRVEADLTAGASAELVAELESLVADHPYRERLWGRLMLALYRAGRQRDALSAFQRARSVLAEQVGVEPGPELRQLEAAILEQSPTLDRVRPAAGPDFTLPLPLEAVGPAFVGRATELSWLRSAWAEAAAGEGRFVSILGPEGIGKTRLVAAVAQEVQAGGALVLYGRCDHTHRSARPLLDQALRSGGSSLAQVEAGETALGDLAGAFARHVATWAQHRPVLLALDDLHLADDETLEVVAELSEWSATAPMLVVAAFRTDDENPAGTTAGIDETTTQVALAGLDREALAQLCTVYATDGWTADDLSRLHDLTAGVPLRIHEQASEWARQRAARLVDEANDRSTMARLRLATSREEVADSVEGIQHLLEERRANLAAREAELADELGTVGASQLCPYKGLASFEAVDAANFFGRERLVAELVARLAGARFLWVVGPSGSGKSSLVRAGLLPALAAGVIPRAGGWNALTVTPGLHPARALARRQLSAGPAMGRRIVFIDQFEEAFTLCADRSERNEFVAGVVTMAGRDDTVVVIAIRADHLDQCAALPQLADLMTGNDVVVGPMNEGELRRVIERPARRAGLTVEPGLVDVIVTDVAGRAGALPLLSTALAETWERRTERRLTFAGYRAAGGVNGALARLAEDAYQSLDAAGRAAARRMLLRLCDAGDDGAFDLRRRLKLAALAPEGDTHARAVVETLVGRRLLTVDGDNVEVAHEALLREWPRLRHWLDDDVQGRRVQRRIGEDARTWRESGEDRSGLYRGTRLDAAVDWSSTHPADLNETERAFLEASRRQAAREIDEAYQQAADRARTNRRLRALLGCVAALLVVALVSGLSFLRQRDRADTARRTATARQLASRSTVALDDDAELSLLLALEAVETTRAAGEAPLPEAIAALHEAVQASRVVYLRDEGKKIIDASRDGTILATAAIEPDSNVAVLDAATGETVRTLVGPPDAPVYDVTFSDDASRVAASFDHTADPGETTVVTSVPAVILWDPTTGEEVARLSAPPGAYHSPSFSGDGLVSATTDDGRIIVWDVTTAAERFSFEPAGKAFHALFTSDGRSLAVAEYDSQRIAFYAADEQHRELFALPTPGFAPQGLAIDRSGRLLAASSQTSGEVQAWNVETRQLLWSAAIADAGVGLQWSPSSDRLAVAGGNASEIRILDAESGENDVVLVGHESGSWDVAFTATGDRLASVDAVGGVRVWDVSADGPPLVGAIAAPPGVLADFELTPDGSEVVLVTREGVIERRSLGTGELLSRVDDQLIEIGYYPQVSGDRRRLASVDRTARRAVVRDVESMRRIGDLPPCTTPAGLNVDGSLVVLNGVSPCAPESRNVPPFPFAPDAGSVLRSRVVELPSGDEILDLRRREVPTAVFNPGGLFPADRYLAVNVGYKAVELYDVQSQRLLTSVEFGDDYAYTLTFDPQGRWLAGGTANGRAWVLDLAAVVAGVDFEDALLFDQIAHDGGVQGIALSDDGLLATTGIGVEFVRLWDVSSGERELELAIDPIGSTALLEFSADGAYLQYFDAGLLRRYLIDTDQLIDLAERLLARDFTADECRQYLDADRCQ